MNENGPREAVLQMNLISLTGFREGEGKGVLALLRPAGENPKFLCRQRVKDNSWIAKLGASMRLAIGGGIH